MSSRSSRPVVVDDTDISIHYIGDGWFQDNGSQDNLGIYGPTYNHTLHGTTRNDSLYFAFNGTSVSILGTTSLVKIENGTRFDPTWECFVDKISIGAVKPFEFQENNWGLCEQSELNDGLHEVTLNVTTTGNTFWFDSLQFVPSPSASYESAVLRVESQDPAIHYDSKWVALGNDANMTTVSGSEMRFNFTGTSLSWVGYIPTELPHNASSASYSIDGGAPVSFELAGLSPTSATTVYNQFFFTTPDLPAGPHSLLVTYHGGGQFTPLTLDFLYITTQSSSDISKHRPPIGAIIGGVFGGLTLITLLLFFILWRKRQGHGIVNTGPRFRPPHVSPFILMNRTGLFPQKMETSTATRTTLQPLDASHITPSTPGDESHPPAYQLAVSRAASWFDFLTTDVGYRWGAVSDLLRMEKEQDAKHQSLPSMDASCQDSGIV